MLQQKQSTRDKRNSEFSFAISTESKEHTNQARQFQYSASRTDNRKLISIQNILISLFLATGPLLSLYNEKLFLTEIIVATSIILFLLIAKNIENTK